MGANDTIAALSALAHEHRLAAFRLLVEAGPNGLSAGLVAERLGVGPSSLSFHLQHLVRAELITQRRVSRQIFYAANFTTMNSLVGYLTENCCGQEGRGGCTTVVCKPGARRRKASTVSRRKSA